MFDKLEKLIKVMTRKNSMQQVSFHFSMSTGAIYIFR